MIFSEENDYRSFPLKEKCSSRKNEVLSSFSINKAKNQQLIKLESNLSTTDKSIRSRKSQEFPIAKKWTSPRMRSVSSGRIKSGELDSSCYNASVSPTSRLSRKILSSYGNIEGVKVGDWWSSRLECSFYGAHKPGVANLHAGVDGAYSIALTGCYDYNDTGYSFIYSGSSCRDLRGTSDHQKNLRSVAQSKCQFVNESNMSLMRSSETGNPVRVIRGYKMNSAYAPSRGYRYDGLYKVEKFWTCRGASGFVALKFIMKRCENQAPAPWEVESSLSKNQIHSIKQLPLELSGVVDDVTSQYQTASQTEVSIEESLCDDKRNSYGDDNKENNTLNVADRLLMCDDFLDVSSTSPTADNSLPRMSNKRKLPSKSKRKQNTKKLCTRPVENVEKINSNSVKRAKSEPASELFRGFKPEYYPRKMILLGFLIHDMQKKLAVNQNV